MRSRQDQQKNRRLLFLRHNESPFRLFLSVMNVLIVGGTRFQGRYLVENLVKSGHKVTVFHKGRHSLDGRPGLTDLIGDRNNSDDLSKLHDLKFDACIDTCAYFPEQVENLGKIVKTKKYCLVSSVFAYKNQYTHLVETSELAGIGGYSAAQLTPENYGALKVMCEQSARASFSEDCLIIRPAIIIGPGDHTERMSFWIRMAACHCKLLAPGDLERTIQFVDVRDLAEFTLRLITDGRSGAINVAGKRYSFQEFLDRLGRLSGNHCQICKIDWERFNQHYLSDLPFCYPGKSENYNSDLARSWGFRDRDLGNSLADIYEHDKKRNFRLTKYQDLENAILVLCSQTIPS